MSRRDHPGPPAWPATRYLAESLVPLALLTWAVFTVAVLGIVVTISVYGTVTTSTWEQATDLVRWFALGMGVQVCHTYLPLHVAHGLTRREFAVQAGVFTVGFTALLATLITVGFLLERSLHRATGWPQELGSERLYGSVTELPLIAATHWLICLVWMVAGGFIAAGFYRSSNWGGLTIPPALGLAALTHLTVGGGGGLDRLPFVEFSGELSVLVSLAGCAAGVLVGLVITWLLVRDLPIRSGST